MKNFVQEGDVVELVAPYDVSSGDGFLVGSLFAVAMGDALNGEKVRGRITGVVDLNKHAGDTPAQGGKVYWDNTAKEVTTTATANTLIGAATLAALGGDATVRVRLNATV